MEISTAQQARNFGNAVHMAVQGQVLAQAKAQGANIAALIAGAPSPAGSANLPTQGIHIDARA
jgi:hypothetical protein